MRRSKGGCVGIALACVASVSVRFRSKERGASYKCHAKNGASKIAGRGLCVVGRLSVHFSRAAKTENLVPRSFFAPKPNENACFAG